MTGSQNDHSQAYVDDRAHVFHSWSAQRPLTPTVVAGGEGANGIRAKGRFAVAFVAWARCGHRLGMQ